MQFVSDWGGFEQLIAKLHETGSVTVQHNVTLTGKYGAPRQIDVLVTHTEGLYTHRILVECKHWKESVKRTQIDAMATAIEDLNASKGVFFTTKGYQSGAETMARAKGIDIFIVREMSDAEWGAPGKVVDLVLHVLCRGIGNVTFPGAQAILMDPALQGTQLPQLNLAIVGGPEGFASSTPVTRAGKADTIERILDVASMEALKALTTKSVTFNDRADCTVHVMGHVEIPLEPALHIPQTPGMFITCPKIECDVAVRIAQSRIYVDRSEKYVFALAVEDCVTGVVYAATREKNASASSLQRLAVSSGNTVDPVQNGSIIRVVMKPFFDFTEMAGMTRVPMPELFAGVPHAVDVRG